MTPGGNKSAPPRWDTWEEAFCDVAFMDRKFRDSHPEVAAIIDGGKNVDDAVLVSAVIADVLVARHGVGAVSLAQGVLDDMCGDGVLSQDAANMVRAARAIAQAGLDGAEFPPVNPRMVSPNRMIGVVLASEILRKTMRAAKQHEERAWSRVYVCLVQAAMDAIVEEAMAAMKGVRKNDQG